jgi:hypothetical protein
MCDCIILKCVISLEKKIFDFLFSKISVKALKGEIT